MVLQLFALDVDSQSPRIVLYLPEAVAPCFKCGFPSRPRNPSKRCSLQTLPRGPAGKQEV